MRESLVENRLVKRTEEVGGACEKFKPTIRGEPDRLLSFPWGYHCLVETKWATGVRPENHQLRRHAYWRARGLDVWLACDDADIARIIAYALYAQTIWAAGNPVSTRSSTWDVSRRPRVGEDQHGPERARHAKDRRKQLLPRLGDGTETSS